MRNNMGLSWKVNSSEKDPELETEPSEVDRIVAKCCEFDNQINLISEAYHLVYGGPKNLLDEFSNLTQIKTPMGNTVLHLAAWSGNDDIVTLLIDRDPRLLFIVNNNLDNVLHVAARAGNTSIIKKLLNGYFSFLKLKRDMGHGEFWKIYREKYYVSGEYDPRYITRLSYFFTRGNNQGNSMLHEAMLGDKSKIDGNMIFKVCEECEIEDWEDSCYTYAIYYDNDAQKTVLYLAVENGNKDAVNLILEKCRKDDICISGLSPLVAAIMMHKPEIFKIILKHQPTLIHSKDTHYRRPLHYAASIGYFEGVDLLLGLCKRCTIQRDKYGYFPIHLASYGGHVKVVKKLLEYCPDPTEMLDTFNQRNFLHIAAKHGKHEVICYILQSKIPEYHKLINQKDKKGETPLHLAARSCHPKTVYYLVNEKNKIVNLDLVNKNNETALDIVISLYEAGKSSLRQHLTWTALKSAGAKQSSGKERIHIESTPNDSNSQKIENNKNKTQNHVEESQESEKQHKAKEIVSKRYKDRLENLTVVSTLIVTISVAACLSVPGEADGKANNLNHAMFQFFIIFITISFFSSISATVILFWATLGLTELVTLTLKIVMPVLGIALFSLSMAFMAGLYIVISKLSWLANVFLAMTVIFVIVVVLLYTLLFLPSPSTTKSLRYFSHYPLLYLASRTECKFDQGLKSWGSIGKN
ncbi:ankyrin repeat-containing protein ITN1-like [Vicia villosa]|uniref:ankyrin repeat-containing protein ITN1-like n=1 Tax=Vicia villosa TaxID=3911 RepID=UPI00273CCA98|nr:ankyrin repeat-containing protein ITN1-like [Vicia villosa]XP_058743218.1 ankyrin repeat-containing protein ITN1-like [Vicia villosa]